MYQQPMPPSNPMTGQMDPNWHPPSNIQLANQQPMSSKDMAGASNADGDADDPKAKASNILQLLTNPMGALLNGQAPSGELIKLLMGGSAIQNGINGNIGGALAGILPLLAGVDMNKFKKKGTKSSPGAPGDEVDPQTGYSPAPPPQMPPQGVPMNGMGDFQQGGDPSQMAAMQKMAQSGMFS